MMTTTMIITIAVPMPIAATSVTGSPLLSTSSGAAFFDGTPMVMMAVADRDRLGRVSGPG